MVRLIEGNYFFIFFVPSSGTWSAAGYVLLHEDAGRDWNLSGTWKRLWSEGWHISLQVQCIVI